MNEGVPEYICMGMTLSIPRCIHTPTHSYTQLTENNNKKNLTLFRMMSHKTMSFQSEYRAKFNQSVQSSKRGSRNSLNPCDEKNPPFDHSSVSAGLYTIPPELSSVSLFSTGSGGRS